MKIVCIYKTGGDFDAEYVEKLYNSVNQLGIDFLCLTDDKNVSGQPLLYSWSGWWAKMELFRPDIDDDLLFFDLDTVIEGDISDILRVCKDKPIMLSDFYFPDKLASGVMYLPLGSRDNVWNQWIKNPCEAASYCGTYGDQKFIRENIEGDVLRWQELLPDMFCSYKLHIKNTAPNCITRNEIDLTKTRVVCYHGKPRPKETGWEGIV